MADETMKVEMVAVGDITPYPDNPRINDEAIKGVAKSLKEFGWKQPIVVDKDNIIVVGHTRYKAAISMGMEKVPVLVANDLTEEQIKAYRISDNSTGEVATWDWDLLKIEMGELDYDFTDFGFTKDQIDGMTDNKEGLTDPDDVPEPKENICKLGDLWLMGEYYECEECGKSFNKEDYENEVECDCDGEAS